MKPKIDGWSIIVAGLWNTRIFMPEWVALNLLGVAESDIELSLNVAPDFYMSFTAKSVVITPKENRVLINVKDVEEPTLQLAEQVALKLLELLPHTPVSALGINFHFIEEPVTPDIASVFRVADSPRLGDAGYETETTEINRRLRLEDQILNFKQSLTDDRLTVALNFHFSAGESLRLQPEQVRGKTLACKEKAFGFVESVYGVHIETGEDNDNH